jgi:AraC-like DNA-binding protein
MATLAEPAAPHDVESLFTGARRRVIVGAGGVRELQLSLDGPPLRARSRLVSSGGVMFVRGENLASQDLVLRHEGQVPLVTMHAPLGGSATSLVDGLGVPIVGEPGHVQLFATPSSRTTVHLRAGVRNEAFRINLGAAVVAALAARHPLLEPLAGRLASAQAFCLPPVAPPRLTDEIAEIMDSSHYGPVRPLFLEARALGWLAMTMSNAAPKAPPESLSGRERERMHEARHLLLSRLADPPTLAEVASAVGTNDFALKRNFKAVFGQPVYAYLLRVRLAHARRLLRDSSFSIKEIASAVGYAHAGHFSTAFRRSYGVTPGRYRGRPLQS